VLITHKLKSIENAKKDEEKSKKYLDQVNSDARLIDEKYNDTLHTLIDDDEDQDQDRAPSIYDELERVPEAKETVIENTSELRDLSEELSDTISFAGIMQIIIKFYATSGINVAVKFAELNELQKAYALLLGVLAKTGYSSYRMGMAIKTGVLSWGHLPQIVNVTATYNIIKNYWAESTKYAELIKFIQEEKEKYIAKKLAEREKRKLFKRY
jgi:hypothetical protein